MPDRSESCSGWCSPSLHVPYYLCWIPNCFLADCYQRKIVSVIDLPARSLPWLPSTLRTMNMGELQPGARCRITSGPGASNSGLMSYLLHHIKSFWGCVCMYLEVHTLSYWPICPVPAWSTSWAALRLHWGCFFPPPAWGRITVSSLPECPRWSQTAPAGEEKFRPAGS